MEPAPKRRRLRAASAEMEADPAPSEAADAPMSDDDDAPLAAAAVPPDAADAPPAAEPVEALPTSAAPSAPDDSSSDSDSESETSSSSSSSESSATSSEEEVDPALMEELPEDKDKETEAQKKQRHLQIVRTAQLRRNELMYLLSDIPPEELDGLLKNAFVLVKTSENQVALAEVMGVEPSVAYECRHPEHYKEVKQLVLQLRCKRGVSEKFIKASAISSGTIEDAHIEQWSKVMHRCRIDPEIYLDSLQDRAEQVSKTKFVEYTEEVVEQILARKRKIEFDAQKQSRMACNVQIGLTQMDISSIKESEMAQLAKDHKTAQDQLHKMEKKEYEAQEQWFDTRRDLYGVKEINRMNIERQKRDDAHALKYALEHEEQEELKINPFERRACRPVSAWDTSLTYVEELEEMKRERLAREARAKQASQAKLAEGKGMELGEGKGMELAEDKGMELAEGKGMETEELKDSKDVGKAEPDDIGKAHADETQIAQKDAAMAAQKETAHDVPREPVLLEQDPESDGEDREPQVPELTQKQKELEEERAQSMGMLKMYQELLRQAKGLNGVA